jgi:dimeric dUTPase (all-alpha-NTP-PPase superfamily)
MTKEQEKIGKLEVHLSHLATKWRSLGSQEKTEDACKIVEEYATTMDQLWSLGWDGGDLLPDSELPDELMPKYFLEYWQRQNHNQQ